MMNNQLYPFFTASGPIIAPDRISDHNPVKFVKFVENGRQA